jgi:hypothetical protein
MDDGEVIRQLMDTNEQLRRENELLRARIKELEALLAKYENPHTPPSLRRGRKGRREQNEGGLGKPGQLNTYHKKNGLDRRSPDRCKFLNQSRLIRRNGYEVDYSDPRAGGIRNTRGR